MLKQIIAKTERTIWQGKPKRFPYIFVSLPLLCFGIIWGLFDLGLYLTFREMGVFASGEATAFFSSYGIPVILVIIFHLTPFWLALFSPLYRLWHWHTVEYAITDRRVYIASGIIGRDVVVLALDEIANLSVSVNLFEKITNSGTVRLTPDASSDSSNTSKNGYRLRSVDEPYEVFKLLRSMSLDVRTDINYPNELRPSVNPGYNSKYDGGEGLGK